MSKKRLVWMLSFGIPIHAWTKRFFATICLNFGSFVKMDENFGIKARLDRAKILISVSMDTDVNWIVKVHVDDKIFTPRIKELSEWQDNQTPGLVNEGDDGMESMWSGNPNGSISVGSADALADDQLSILSSSSTVTENLNPGGDRIFGSCKKDSGLISKQRFQR